MSQTVKTNCNHCGRGLDDAGAMPTFMLTLMSGMVPNSGDIVYSYASHPEIDAEHHFCGLRCLKNWINALTDNPLWEHWERPNGT